MIFKSISSFCKNCIQVIKGDKSKGNTDTSNVNEEVIEPSKEIEISIHNPICEYAHGKRFKSPPKWIVVHYTACANVSAKNMCKAMKNNTSASSHFYIDENDIYSAVPLRYVAWHVGSGQCNQPDPLNKKSLEELSVYKSKDWRYDLAAKNHIKWISEGCDFKGNSVSIGVDLCVKKKSTKTRNATDTDWYFDDKAVDNAAKLIAYLMKLYDIELEHVIRHGDASGKLCLPLYNTEIMTPAGFVKLNDIKVGDSVYQYNPETNLIEITQVLSKVEPYTSTVCVNRGFEATLNHRMITKTARNNIRECQFSDLLGKQYYYISSCDNNNVGVDLTDDQIRLLVQIQGDGHLEYKYTDRRKQHKKLMYVSFHLKKERKILNLTQLLNRLELKYTIINCKNNTVYFRIKYDLLESLINNWLINKCFSNKFLNLSKKQFEVFLDELWKVDACVTTNKLLYATNQKQNLNIVQALCAMNNIRTHFYMQKSVYLLSIVRSRHSSSRDSYSFYDCEVSCIEVPSSYIIIRQNGYTFITGNCPQPFTYQPEIGDKRWNDFKEKISNYLNSTITANFI